jgi:hypothetical protein
MFASPDLETLPLPNAAVVHMAGVAEHLDDTYLKDVLGHILLNYDVQLEEGAEGMRPKRLTGGRR